jgi:hypothetical protein
MKAVILVWVLLLEGVPVGAGLERGFATLAECRRAAQAMASIVPEPAKLAYDCRPA